MSEQYFYDYSSRIIVFLSILSVMLCLAFMFYNIQASWSFTLYFRGCKLVSLVIVAGCIAISSVLFQTITQNHILTPSIIGFDQLYLLIQTIIVFVGDSFHFNWYGKISIFLINSLLLTLFSTLLFRLLFAGCQKSLYLVLLAGVICNVFFRSITNLLGRMIEPNAFIVLQDSYYANFNYYNSHILIVAVVIIIVVFFLGWPMRYSFDVLALGRETALALGINYHRSVTTVLFLITILVSISTALVGPVTFFGLLVTCLASQFARTTRHDVLLPISILIAIIALVGGQFLLERFFQFNTVLSVIIEFTGGVTFLVLLLHGKIR